MVDDRDVSKQIASWLMKANKPVVFTGAGISTESGIPDFRSPGGVWTKYRTVYYEEFLASPEARHEYWRQKSEGHRAFADSQPNVGHQIIAAWETQGLIHGVITQNIDGLHQLAGSKQVLELHGTAREIICLDCSARYDAEPLVESFLTHDQVPTCSSCSCCRLKHATISFGQSLPQDILQEAVQWCEEASLLFAIGSSLVVTPAAELPKLTKVRGGRLIIINRDDTPLDSLADRLIRESIGESLQAIERERKRLA
ncbi:MAG: NAD-dependent protein deacylase [Pirellulaceae bacterium]|nr:NAD-dependent protein deacylase [Pirellulaceae bacterium]